MFQRFQNLAAIAAVVLAAGLGSARTASAGVAPVTVSLDTLLNGGSNDEGIVIGDKRYSNFFYSSTGQMEIDAKDVEVVFAVEGNSHFTAFLFDLASTGTGRSDLVIQYDLNVLDPLRTIEGVGLLFDGGPFEGDGGADRGTASVIETISTLDGSPLTVGGGDEAQITVFNDGIEGLDDNFDTTLDIIPTRGLRFAKDILVSSRGLDVSISVVENSVTQSGTIIPLPAAFWAAAPILGALVAGRKIRRLTNRN
jgi:hypothetical protein